MQWNNDLSSMTASENYPLFFQTVLNLLIIICKKLSGFRYSWNSYWIPPWCWCILLSLTSAWSLGYSCSSIFSFFSMLFFSSTLCGSGVFYVLWKTENEGFWLMNGLFVQYIFFLLLISCRSTNLSAPSFFSLGAPSL